jgi:hypothetical protein
MSEETDEMRNSRLESITLTEVITRPNSKTKSDEPIICFYMFDWVSWCCQFEFKKNKCCHHNYVCFACCCSISFQ